MTGKAFHYPFRWRRLVVASGFACIVACSGVTRRPIADAGGDADSDALGDECAAMDAHEGPDTCDGGGSGYKWNGEDCVYQGDLCNCLGADCGRLHETVEACREAYAPCIEPDCEALVDGLVRAFEDAVLCDPAMSSLQCDGAEMITNQCGCPWAANNRHPDLARTARDAWEPYEAAGCIPQGCGPCREPTPTFRCTRLPIGTQGTCEIAD